MTGAQRRPALARRFGDLPLRWKILLPFAFLAVLYGTSATYIFSRGTAAEQRANLTARLRDVATVVTNDLEKREFGLIGTARVIGRTQGVAKAIARGDRARLGSLVLPPVGNSSHSVAVVADARGIVLLDVRIEKGAPPRTETRGDWSAVPLIPGAAGAREAPSADFQAAFIEQGGISYLAVAGPISAERGGPIGVALVGDRLDEILRGLGALTDAGLTVTDESGRTLAGRPVPAPPADMTGATQLHALRAGRSVELLYVPVTIRSERAGMLVVALPSASGLGALGREAWKIAFLAIAALAGVFLVGVWVARWISHPLGDLLESTRALGRRELGRRVGMDRRDEVGELGRSFDQMAQELEASHHELERRVEERTRELAEALDHLDRANVELGHASDAKSAFLTNMSHELRTPLSAILMAAEMLHDPAFGPLPEKKVRDLGGRIHGSGKHLLALIDDLLDLSRIEAGRLELRPQPVPLASSLAEVAMTVGPIAREKGVALNIPATDGERILADPLRLRQILLNLLTNAIKFTEPGGTIWVEVASSNRTVAVAVRDTGIGIERKHLKRIFEPFEQVSGTAGLGVGLGLAISKRIAELQGGRLRVSSTPGEGSTFTLTLPKANATGEATASAGATPRRRRTGGNSAARGRRK